MLISSGNTTDTTRNDVQPKIWAPATQPRWRIQLAITKFNIRKKKQKNKKTKFKVRRRSGRLRYLCKRLCVLPSSLLSNVRFSGSAEPPTPSHQQAAAPSISSPAGCSSLHQFTGRLQLSPSVRLRLGPLNMQCTLFPLPVEWGLRRKKRETLMVHMHYFNGRALLFH